MAQSDDDTPRASSTVVRFGAERVELGEIAGRPTTNGRHTQRGAKTRNRHVRSWKPKKRGLEVNFHMTTSGPSYRHERDTNAPR